MERISGLVTLVVTTDRSKYETESTIRDLLTELADKLKSKGIQVTEVHGEKSLEREGIDF